MPFSLPILPMALRRAADFGLSHFAKWRADRLDSRPTDVHQRLALMGLVHKARDTRFGRDHDFRSIRNVEDYQRRVPLREYEDFWTSYWSGPFPNVRCITWPGSLPYFALSSGTTSGTTKY